MSPLSIEACRRFSDRACSAVVIALRLVPKVLGSNPALSTEHVSCFFFGFNVVAGRWRGQRFTWRRWSLSNSLNAAHVTCECSACAAVRRMRPANCSNPLNHTDSNIALKRIAAHATCEIDLLHMRMLWAASEAQVQHEQSFLFSLKHRSAPL